MSRRSAAFAIACSCLVPAAGAWAGDGVVPLTTVRVASGLNRPILATHAPGDESRLFIVEQRGVIKILDLTTNTVLPVPFLDIDALVPNISGNDERGLLGLAFHPDYQNNGFFYVNYTNLASDTVIRRYTVSGDPDVADPTSAFTLLTIDQPFSNHNGGWLDFGPDGFLYIATGDGGSACDPGQRAQDITNQLLGKMLRIDVDGGSPYAIPPGNPFVGIAGDDEIWAYGLRNPWRASFDRETGDLYIADVGQDAWEEVDFQPANGSEDPKSPDYQGGKNYGWDCMEGNGCSTDSDCSTSACTCFSNDLTDPIHVYPHPQGFSITGGNVYRGCAIPSLDGTYFFADFVITRIWSFKVVDGNVTEFADRTAELTPSADGFFISTISSFGEDARGEIYIVDRSGTSSGEIFKIIPEIPIPDFDCDGFVGISDLLSLLAAWGPCNGCPQDLDGDGQVGITDLLILLAQWGPVG
ncbi:MAG: PQQ-dependent sugar dehydrogenase [Planctomycetota bacterium]|jgi:glucose/arabinose dehydrogenase